MNPVKELEKSVKIDGDGDNNWSWCNWKGLQGFGTIRNQRKNRDWPDYSIVEIGQNSVKRPGHLRRLTAASTPVKDDQLMLVWKTHKKYSNDNKEEKTQAGIPPFRRQTKKKMAGWNWLKSRMDYCIICENFMRKYKSKLWVSWSASVILIVNIGDLRGILWVLAVLFQVHKLRIKGKISAM